MVNATILKAQSVAFQVCSDFFVHWLISEFQNLSCKAFFFFLKEIHKFLFPGLHWIWKESCTYYCMVLFIIIFFYCSNQLEDFFFFFFC